jgi:hypothetical protein
VGGVGWGGAQVEAYGSLDRVFSLFAAMNGATDLTKEWSW